MTVTDLKKYKDNLYTSLSRDLSEFEKNFLLISGGILAFSISFIKEIVKIDQALCLPLLYISWAFIILSIGLMMFTFLKSSIASDELWSIVDNFVLTNKLYKDEIDLTDIQVEDIKNEVNSAFYRVKGVLKKLRYFSVSAFILGVTFLALYVSINLNFENKSKSNINKDVSNASIIDSIVIYKNNKSLKINCDYGKDNKTYATKTNTSIAPKSDTKTNSSNKGESSASDTKTR